MPILSTRRFHYGLGYPHPLPEGWKLIDNPEDFARAEDSAGQVYFLTRDGKAYLRRIAVIAVGTLNPGDPFIDETGSYIDLTQAPPSPEVTDRVRALADDYIANTFPDPIGPRQAIEIRLALYAGMFAMFQQLIAVQESHQDDDDAAADELDEVRRAIIDRALTLNRARQSI
jgi:hypothetical protein